MSLPIWGVIIFYLYIYMINMQYVVLHNKLFLGGHVYANQFKRQLQGQRNP